MATTDVHSFATIDEVSQALNAYLERLSRSSIAARGRFTVAFSGGSLPSTVAQHIKHNGNIDFSKWHVFWADERCVPLDSDDSNFKLVKDALLAHVAVPPSQVIAINAGLVGDSQAAAADYEAQMRRVFGGAVAQFDCVLLGIGPDGHTCSLFPGMPQVEERVRWVTHIDDSPKPPPSRITLTMPVLNAARNVAFVVTGGNKADMVRRVVDARDVTRPSARVQPAGGAVVWFVDDATARDLVRVKPSPFKL